MPDGAPDHAKAPVALVSFDDDGRIVAANAAFGELLGTTETPVGTTFTQALSPASRIFHTTHFFPLLRLHGRADEMHVQVRRGEEDVPVLASAVREERPDGRALNHCAMLVMRQRQEFELALIQARRAAEAAAQSKDQFLAMVSHELRNPLSAILGWIRLVRSGKLEPALQARALDSIQRSAESQAQLIEDLLDLSRVASGKLRISPRSIDMAEVIEASLDIVRPAARARGVDLASVLESPAPPAFADPQRMQQVLVNLLGNAVKFTPRGGRALVRLARVHSRLRVEVVDTGRGIAKDDLAYVFDRFWQAEGSAERERAGLGLGLAICRNLVELHGGTIGVDSEGPGRGACFYFEVPIAAAPADALAQAQPGGARAASLAGLRLLVVDDDDGARALLAMILEKSGAFVETAGSCDDALGLLRGGTEFDAVVTDIAMTGRDGFALVRELRGDAQLSERAPVAIAVTGMSRPQDRVALLRAGFQAHLTKPVEPEELVAIVASLCRRAVTASA